MLALHLALLAPAGAGSVDHEDLDAAVELVEEHYLDPVDRDALYRAAIEGMLRYLDTRQGHPGNALMDMGGSFPDLRDGRGRGIGVEVLAVPGQGMLVTQVFDGSPAARAGIARGDAIVAMDGRSFAGLGASAIQAVAHSCAGAEVDLEILGADGDRRRLHVARGPYVIPPVWRQPDAPLPAIRVRSFSTGAAHRLAVLLAGESDPPLVLDLRDNPGGLVDEAVGAADLFLPPGAVIGSERGRNGEERQLVSSQEPLHRGPVAVLVNQGTTGVAELFTQALRQQGRALVVGLPTAGVTRTTRDFKLGDDLVLRLTDGDLRSPRGLGWSPDGLRPDVLVDHAGTVMLSPNSAPPDIQMEAALRLVGTSSR